MCGNYENSQESDLDRAIRLACQAYREPSEPLPWPKPSSEDPRKHLRCRSCGAQINFLKIRRCVDCGDQVCWLCLVRFGERVRCRPCFQWWSEIYAKANQSDSDLTPVLEGAKA